MDRDLIRKNEFGWVLENNISELDHDGMLPPRFAGLARGAMLRQISKATPANKRRKISSGGAVAVAGTSSSAAGAGSGGGRDVAGPSAHEVAYYSELALPPASAHEAEEVSERSKGDLVRRWLRRKLYEEVQEQVSFLAVFGVGVYVGTHKHSTTRDIHKHPPSGESHKHRDMP